ncbi:MAG TPA: cysteine desulfurase family protein [Alphaproteobacteria bacterium]|nr:cysteine desulfurase family protein [Alphaproteobacteria bacterium]
MMEILGQVGNASSIHAFGRAARRIVEDARERVAALVGVSSPQVVFTSGATEANNTVLALTDRPRVLVSAIEHDSVLAAAPDAEIVPVTPEGLVDLAALEAMLDADNRPSLVAVMLANNEIGTLQPVAEVAAIAKRHGALVHCDAVQATGKIPVDFVALDIDFMSLSAHKLGGPQGNGALIVREGVPVPTLIRGGGQEKRRRAGTENVAGIAGFGAAAEAAAAGLGAYNRVAVLRDALESRIRAAFPETPIFGGCAPRIANTSCIAMPGMSAETQLMGFDLAGIAVSSGSACSSGKVAASHVLAALGVGRDLAKSAVRVSLGWDADEGQIERFVETWITLRQKAERRTAVA